MKLITIEVDNFKRLRAFRAELSAKGLTIIGGRNGQGKTSVLSAIAWGLGGGKLAPSNPRNGEEDPYIKLTLDNGITVERKGKNSTLVVSDEKGMRGGQTLLDGFLCELALDLPRFMNADSKKKGEMLLGALGIGEQLEALEAKIKETFAERASWNRVVKDAEGALAGMEFHEDAEEKIDVAALNEKFANADHENRNRQQLRENLTSLRSEERNLAEQIEELQRQLEMKKERLKATIKAIDAYKDRDLEEIDTSAIMEKISDAERHNRKVEANERRLAARKELQQKKANAAAEDEKLTDLREQRVKLLDTANLPLEGLGVEEGELRYKGQAWDCMSGSEQLVVSASIAQAIKPECRFVLMDKLEQMDMESLEAFEKWASEQDLQIIATRVSVGDECSFVIEDGAVLEALAAEEVKSDG